MCGICGVLSDDQAEIEPAVRRMMDAMIHRGPDDDGFALNGGHGDNAGPAVGFGFRRLAILDLTSTGHQPMYNPLTGDCLIFNGEIYNFRRLRAELQCEGVVFRGNSDTEVLLHAMSRWGEATLKKIQGMYAIAFFDAKSRRVLLARDPLGIKPLYVAESASRIIFASEVRAVLATGLVSDALDQAGIVTLLAYGAPQDPLTIHKEIRSFPAGHAAWVELQPCRPLAPIVPRAFWRFPAVSDLPPTPGNAARHLRSLLQSAVASHLVADRPVGVFLSAGLDSFAIAALAKAVHGSIDTFTVGFNEAGRSDEIDESAKAAKLLGTSHNPVVLDADEVPELWESWLADADRPSIDGFNTFVVSHAVRAAGKTVAISGLGGDELFGGYPNFTAVRRYSRFLRIIGPIPSLIRDAGLRVLLRSRSESFQQRVLELARGGTGFEAVALRLRRILTDAQIADLLTGLESVCLDEHLLDCSSLASIATPPRDDGFNVISRLECGLYMGNTLLRDTDSVSMSRSLEVRVPLLDQGVIDYVLQLPENMKYRVGGPTKLLLRSALDGVIPKSLLERPKTGFCLPIDRWMHGPLRDSCQSAIEYVAKSSLLDPVAVRKLWEGFIASPSNVHWVRPMVLVALGSYLQRRAVNSGARAKASTDRISGDPNSH